MNTRSTVVVIQHVACETLGTIEQSLTAQGLATRTVRVFDGEPAPVEIADACGLVVLGGPMSAYETDRWPHLRDEMKLIESALATERAVLGVCLGSQLLAQVLGDRVYPGSQKEIGWHEVRLTEHGRGDDLFADVPDTFMGFHWHGDVFDLPGGCEKLAESEITPCQAFRSGASAYGVLFHMEVTELAINAMSESFPDELAEARVGREQLRSGAQEHLQSLIAYGRCFFGGWARCAADLVNCK